MKLKGPESVLATALLLGSGLILRLASSSAVTTGPSNSSQDHHDQHVKRQSSRSHWPTSKSFGLQRRSVMQSLSGMQNQSQHLSKSVFEEALQGSQLRRVSNGASGKQFRGICLWDCQPATTTDLTQPIGQQSLARPQKQNTTQLLLYTEPNTGDQAQATLSKYSSVGDLKHRGNFNPRAPTYLMVHGFRGSGVLRQPWFVEAKDLILNKGSANVFFADWSHHSRTLSYPHALEHIPVIAADLYAIMRQYEVAFSSANFKMTNMKVVGHSLGAHIAGLLGQLMQGELEEILASDPAGFLINDLNPKLRLSHHDAKYVLAIHTNAQYFGTIMNVADRDVFYEDGTNQPACQHEKLMPSICNHKQATKFATTHSGRCIQMAYRCSDHLAFAAGRCGFCRPDSEDCVAVGHSWQYNFGEDDEQLDLRPADFREKAKQVEEGPRNNTRYFLKSGPKSPYCAYHFQVVAWFSDSSDMDGLESFELRLMANTTSGGATMVKMSRHETADQLEVFDDAGEQDTVSSRHLYTGLALIRTTHILYKLMPIKFARAILLDDIRDRTYGLKVHVNFMSEPRLSKRAAYSGPVEASFSQIRHLSEASTTPDLRAAASSHHQTPYISSSFKRRHSHYSLLGF